MKQWCVVERKGKVVDFIDMTNKSVGEMAAWQCTIDSKYHDEIGWTEFRYVCEKEYSQIIECYDSEMVLLARVLLTQKGVGDQVKEFQRLRVKYPKCAIGTESWKPGLKYFES